MPGRFFQAALNGACFKALAVDGNASLHSPSGGSSIEASRPLSGRFTSSTAPDRSRTTKAAPRLRGRAILDAFTGNCSWMPNLRARQSSVHGQLGQAGRLVVQMA